MATKKSMITLFGVLVISAFVLASVIQVGAETLKFKTYSYGTKVEQATVGDVEGHTVRFTIRRGFVIFENGEVATQISVSTSEQIKESASSLVYTTINFSDGSTIIYKTVQSTTWTAPGASGSAKLTREIIKGTGRFEGIKGTGASTIKYFKIEEGEIGPKGVGDGSLTYTLPSK